MLLSALGNLIKCQPFAQYRMCHIHARPEIDVHLFSHDRPRGFDEETRCRSTRDAPHDIGRLMIVPCDCFSHHCCSPIFFCQVGTDVLESLSGGVGCRCLHRRQLNAERLDGETDLDLCQSFLKLSDIARDNYDVCSLLCELNSDALAHTLRGSGKKDSLEEMRRG